jgi:Methyltransferase domain
MMAESGSRLVDGLGKLLSNLQDAEFKQLVALLSRSLQGLTGRVGARRSVNQRALSAVLSAVHALPVTTPTAIDPPPLWPRGLLRRLLAEARSLPRSHRYRGDEGARLPQADRLATSSRLVRRAECIAGPLLPMGISEYAIVERHGEWKLDEESLVVRMIIPLGACRVLYRDARRIRSLSLSAGTPCVLWPGLTVHRVSARSRATVLYIDFCPLWAPHDVPPFVRTPRQVARAMLSLAQVSAADVVYDLGCGDGAIMLVASKMFRSRALGIEASPRLCARARSRLAEAGVAARCRVIPGDLATADLGVASVVTLFLNPDENERARKRIEVTATRGCRIVSHLWPVKGWKPTRIEYVSTARSKFEHRIYLYRL